jgi:nitrite reductase/ring-hydroxylating ferredoxin subunit
MSGDSGTAAPRRDVRVAVAAVPDGGAVIVPVDERLTLAIFRVGEAFYALDNACPHRGGPLGEGAVTGTVVTCPWHGFTVDLRTGRCPRSPWLRVRTFTVAREDDTLRVVVPA